MDALMTLTALTYDDLAEIADILTRLLSAEGQGLDLNPQRGAAQGEVATLRGVLEFERERTSELSRFAQLAPRTLSSPARFRRGMPNTPSVGWATQACLEADEHASIRRGKSLPSAPRTPTRAAEQPLGRAHAERFAPPSGSRE